MRHDDAEQEDPAVKAHTYDGRQDVEFQARQEVAELAHDMVRIDTAIERAKRREEWAEIGLLLEQREGVQEHRSQLMREVYTWRKKERA
jgi:hypothetical protein